MSTPTSHELKVYCDRQHCAWLKKLKCCVFEQQASIPLYRKTWKILETIQKLNPEVMREAPMPVLCSVEAMVVGQEFCCHNSLIQFNNWVLDTWQFTSPFVLHPQHLIHLLPCIYNIIVTNNDLECPWHFCSGFVLGILQTGPSFLGYSSLLLSYRCTTRSNYHWTSSSSLRFFSC